jgi:hypothetical protein
MDQLKSNLKVMDADLFVKLRDGILTFDQIRSRIQSRHFNCDYKIIDDLKEDLYDPKIMEPNRKQEQQILNMYGVSSFKNLPVKKMINEVPISNERCMKSLYNNVQKNMSRERKQ